MQRCHEDETQIGKNNFRLNLHVLIRASVGVPETDIYIMNYLTLSWDVAGFTITRYILRLIK